MPKQTPAPESGIERGGKRPKAKPAVKLAWALQDRQSGEVLLHHIRATRELASEQRVECANPDRVRVVRVRIEVLK